MALRTPSSVSTTAALPGALGLPAGRAFFSVKEAAALLGRSPQFIRDAFDNQAICGHALASRRDGRRSLVIPREALQLFLLESANYQPADYVDRLAQLLRRLSPEAQRQLRALLDGSPTQR